MMFFNYRRYLQFFLFVLSLLWIYDASAHAPEENYFWINVETDHLSGRFEVHKDDIRNKLGINVEGQGEALLESVRATQEQVHNYVLEHFSIEDSEGQLQLEFQDAQLFEEGEKYLQYPFRINQLPKDNKITISNSVFLTPDLMKNDRLHRSLVVVEYNKAVDREYGVENVALVFGPSTAELEIDLSDPQPVLQWKDFLLQGVLHIGIGLDHVLFIILLLLTAVLKQDQGNWVPMPRFAPALWKMVKIVTIFTIAHSITLSLAALNLVSINTTLIEAVIALSIVAVAINNIFPKFVSHAWLLIFIFGLFHGLGFASVMSELQFRTVLLERILIMFNVGVELGQIAIVCVVFPFLFLIRKYSHYRRVVVTPVSVAAAGLASFWVLQRVGVLS